MLSCKDLVHRHASDYLDGQLPLRARWSVSLHLALCVRCRRFMKQFRGVIALLRDEGNSAGVENSEA
ncbi:MAG: zf-HC2 domain-containing protein [Halioglobus sp.]